MIQADADTYTDQSFPDTNYGTGVELWAGNANGTKQTYLRFPQLASLAGYYIYSAELRLYPIDVIGTNWDYEGFVGMLESGWNEPTLTWNNNTTSVKAGTGWIMQVKEYPYNNWDVTGVVRKWYAGELLPHGFTVAARSVNIGEAVMAKYHSRAGAHPPELVITCGSAPPTITRIPTQTPTPSRTPTPTATTIPVDYQILAVEVTQGIAGPMLIPGQPAPTLGVPKVWGKPTYVRVVAGTFRNGTPYDAPTQGVAVTLWATDGLGSNDPSVVSAITKPAVLKTAGWRRGNAEHVYLFEVPRFWHASPITLEVLINGVSEPETMKNNNRYSFQLNFRGISPICGVFVRYTPIQASHLPIICGTQPRARRSNAAALSILPAADIRVYYRTDPVEEYQWESASYGPYELDGDEWKINTTLWWTDQWSDDPDECDDAGARTHYIGMVKPGAGDNSFNGLGNTIGDQLVFNMRTNSPGALYNTPWGGRSLAHELGHDYYLDHTGCGTTDQEPGYPYDNCRFADPTGDQRNDWYGFDVINLISIAPPTGDTKLGDLMSYSNTRWSSDWTWRDIFTQLFVQDATNSTASEDVKKHLSSAAISSEVALAEPQAPDAAPVLLVTGYANETTGEYGMDRLQVTDPAWLPRPN